MYLTADPIIYALNENIRIISQTIGENYAYPLMGSFVTKVFNELNSIDVDEIKFSINEIKKFFVILWDILKKDINITDEVDLPYDIPQVLYSKIIDAINIYQKDFTVILFGNERVIDFTLFRCKGFYTASILLNNIYKGVKWLSLLKLNFVNNIQTIWIIAKMIHDGGLTDKYIALKKFAKYFFEGNESQEDFVNIYTIGEKIGIKSYLLTEEEKYALNFKIGKPDLAQLRFMEADLKTGEQNQPKENLITLLPAPKSLISWFLKSTATPEKLISSVSEFIFSVLNSDSELFLLNKRYNMKPDDQDAMPYRDGINILPRLGLIRKILDESWKTELDQWREHLDTHYIYLMYLLKESTLKNIENKKTYKYALKESTLGLTQLGSIVHLYRELDYYPIEFEEKFVPGKINDVVIEPNPEFFEEIQKLLSKLESTVNDISNLWVDNPHKSDSELFALFSKVKKAIDLCLENKQNQLNDIEDEFLDKELKEFISNNDKSYNGWYLNLLMPTNTNRIEKVIQHNYCRYEYALNYPYDDFKGSTTLEILRFNKIGLTLVPITNKKTGVKKQKIMIFSTYNPIELAGDLNPEALEKNYGFIENFK